MSSQMIFKSDICYGCQRGESSYDAEDKMSATHQPWTTSNLAQAVKEHGVHSGLIGPSGKIFARHGYAQHAGLSNEANLQHNYSDLVANHGWVRVSGAENGSENVSLNFEHHKMNGSQRRAAGDLAMYAHGNGLRVKYGCHEGRGAWDAGDHEKLLEHLSSMDKSLRKSSCSTCGHGRMSDEAHGRKDGTYCSQCRVCDIADEIEQAKREPDYKGAMVKSQTIFKSEDPYERCDTCDHPRANHHTSSAGREFCVECRNTRPGAISSEVVHDFGSKPGPSMSARPTRLNPVPVSLVRVAHPNASEVYRHHESLLTGLEQMRAKYHGTATDKTEKSRRSERTWRP